jgi:DNA-binding transcriptional ArsR family regulator
MGGMDTPKPRGPGAYRRQARILKALASESRLAIVHRLSAGESCVCDLVTLVGTDQSTVSKHLAVLRDAGIVDAERRGQHSFYRLVAPCVVNFLTCAEDVLKRREDIDEQVD